MKRTVITALVFLVPFEANAIIRYLVQDMTCDEVQEAIKRDGEAILYRQASAGGQPLYDRYVSGANYCKGGQKIARASVATADTKNCSVSKCEDSNRP
jgi:hypothetical protein